HRPTPRRIHRQEQNMTAESSTHTYENGVQETVTLRRGPATPHDCALLKITYSDGEIADCYVNTAWLRDRADQLTDTPRPLARERLDGWKTEWERRIKAEKERDKARAGARLAFDRYREVQAERQKVVDELYRIRAEKAEEELYRIRAEEAEEERDEARRYECSDLDAHWRLGEALASLKEANATVASLRAEQPRPLTADDIEQLVTQNRYRVADAIRALYPEEPMATDVLAHAGMTALTEPTRPEEKVEAVLHQYWSGDINGDDLANRIVEEMNR